MLFYCCTTADILTKHLQQYFLFFIVGNSQVSVYRTIGPTLVNQNYSEESLRICDRQIITCDFGHRPSYQPSTIISTRANAPGLENEVSG